MKPLYLIVHPPVITMREKCNQPQIASELERIMREEDHVLLKGSTDNIPASLPKDRCILVCGIYKEICVWQACESLKDNGYNAEIYDAASFNAP